MHRSIVQSVLFVPLEPAGLLDHPGELPQLRHQVVRLAVVHVIDGEVVVAAGEVIELYGLVVDLVDEGLFGRLLFCEGGVLLLEQEGVVAGFEGGLQQVFLFYEGRLSLAQFSRPGFYLHVHGVLELVALGVVIFVEFE